MASVYLAVGHGIKPDGTFDPGAVSRDGSQTEQASGDVVVRIAAKILEDNGVDVVSEADKDDPNFYGTVAAANEADVDLAVSVHHDWNKAPSGGFGFWYPGSEGGKKAADQIKAAYRRRQLPVRDEWHKARSLYFTKNTAMHAVLWECGRIGEYSVKELKTIGEAIAEGVAGYFGIDLKAQEESNPHSPTVKTTARMLKKGAKGRDVAAVQALNKELGVGSSAIDGDFGPKTEDDVEDAQRKLGAEQVDGIVGRETWGLYLNV